jgi:hypothetical protein
MPGPHALRMIGWRLLFAAAAAAAARVVAADTLARAGHGLLLISLVVAVLGSAVFVLHTWF